MLYRWVKEYEEFGEEAFSGNGRRKNFELENRKLKKVQRLFKSPKRLRFEFIKEYSSSFSISAMCRVLK